MKTHNNKPSEVQMNLYVLQSLNQIQNCQLSGYYIEFIDSISSAQLNDLRKNLSITSIMTIPFISINFYDKVYMVIQAILNSILLLYKNTKYPIPSYALGTQVTVIIAIILTQLIRYHIGKKAVLQKNPGAVAHYLVISLLLLPAYVFMLRLQTYVLFIDWVMDWVGIGLLIIEIGIAAWLLTVFRRKKKLS